MLYHLFIPIAQAAGAPAAGGFNPGPLVYLGCIFVIFYFLIIRPQSQKQKQLDALVKGVKTGDRVVTASGIHGMVSNVKETTVLLKVADNVKIEVEKSSIGTVLKRAEDETVATAAS